MDAKKAISKLCSTVAKKEGRKHQASIGDVREIVAYIAEELFLDAELTTTVLEYGRQRVQKKVKK